MENDIDGWKIGMKAAGDEDRRRGQTGNLHLIKEKNDI